MSALTVLALFALLMLALSYASIADAYDEARFEVDPGYCRYGASFSEVMTWWWNRYG
jgi:hypothetical protein